MYHDIQKHIYNKTAVIPPISGGNGQSQDQAVIINSKAKYRLYNWVEKLFVNWRFYK